MTNPDQLVARPAMQVFALGAAVRPGVGIPDTNVDDAARIVLMLGDRLVPYVSGIRVEQTETQEEIGPLDQARIPAAQRRTVLLLEVAPATAFDPHMTLRTDVEPTLTDAFERVLSEPMLPAEPRAVAELLVAAIRGYVTGTLPA